MRTMAERDNGGQSSGSNGPPRRFLLFTMVRSGSYNLVGLLDSAADLVCYSEVYKPKWVELPKRVRATLNLAPKAVADRDAMGPALFDRLAGLNPGMAAVGFKLMPNHIGDARRFLADLLLDPEVAVVILSRPILEIGVSFLTAQETGTFTERVDAPKTGPEEAAPAPQVVFDEDNLRRILGMTNRFRRFCRKTRAVPGKRVLDIRYEETLVPTHQARLLAFLGSKAEPGALQSPYLKQSRSPLHTRVANWDWLVAHLRRTDSLALLGEAGYRADGTPY